jgi:hypothetical protein
LESRDCKRGEREVDLDELRGVAFAAGGGVRARNKEHDDSFVLGRVRHVHRDRRFGASLLHCRKLDERASRNCLSHSNHVDLNSAAVFAASKSGGGGGERDENDDDVKAATAGGERDLLGIETEYRFRTYKW